VHPAEQLVQIPVQVVLLQPFATVFCSDGATGAGQIHLNYGKTRIFSGEQVARVDSASSFSTESLSNV
jgi:hypothetical protein